VQWVPRAFGIKSDRTTQIDKTARELAADFGMHNFRSPELGKPAIDKPTAHPATSQTSWRTPPAGTPNVFEPMPGWRIQIPDYALQGQGHAVCAPTGVTAKIKIDPNSGPLKESNPQMSMARMRAATRIEGSTRGNK
jgi:hypothetical protein